MWIALLTPMLIMALALTMERLERFGKQLSSTAGRPSDSAGQLAGAEQRSSSGPGRRS